MPSLQRREIDRQANTGLARKVRKVRGSARIEAAHLVSARLCGSLVRCVQRRSKRQRPAARAQFISSIYSSASSEWSVVGATARERLIWPANRAEDGRCAARRSKRRGGSAGPEREGLLRGGASRAPERDKEHTWTRLAHRCCQVVLSRLVSREPRSGLCFVVCALLYGSRVARRIFRPPALSGPTDSAASDSDLFPCMQTLNLLSFLFYVCIHVSCVRTTGTPLFCVMGAM